MSNSYYSVSKLIKLSDKLYKCYVHHPEVMWLSNFSYGNIGGEILDIYAYSDEDAELPYLSFTLTGLDVTDAVMHMCSEKYCTCFYIILDDMFNKDNVEWNN